MTNESADFQFFAEYWIAQAILACMAYTMSILFLSS